MSNNNRGLASADDETKARVAKAGGQARAQNPGSLAEAGRKGGEAVVEKYGPEHMSEIGRKGGEARSQYKESLREASRRGGRQ